MKLPKFSKKLVAIGAAAGIAMGAAGIAAAYLSAGGSGTGTATVSASATFTVTPTAITNLAIGVPAQIQAVVQNNTKGTLKLTNATETITIESVTPVAGNSCTVDTFGLLSTDGWHATPQIGTITFDGANRVIGQTLDTNPFAQTVTVPAGYYFDANGGTATATKSTGALGENEWIVFLTNPAKTQKGCLGATVNLTVTV